MTHPVRALLALVALLVCVRALAADMAPPASDPELEARVQRVAEELRCLVCQNQTIADSNAELAQDLRGQVRTMLARGASEQEVREFMVARYGDFVLYRPPMKATTLVLWVGPFVLLLGGAWILRRVVVARRRSAQAQDLSAEDAARVRELVGTRTEPHAR
ncbi:MAG: cytochrome c-type biogenesis protein CcmH [Burkholderiales bacterium]|nr:cytochrome c-type biogenesis protein CcmH [Burkholderiales bacterium]